MTAVLDRGDDRGLTRPPEATALAKIPDGDGFWHRMGDVGYLDDATVIAFCLSSMRKDMAEFLTWEADGKTPS